MGNSNTNTNTNTIITADHGHTQCTPIFEGSGMGATAVEQQQSEGELASLHDTSHGILDVDLRDSGLRQSKRYCYSEDRPSGRPSQTSEYSLPRFLADFTLGFADGLTVPFALTAGLSSLGQTDTVIYAGMAEICAGCISMGIGGYLAAEGAQMSGPDDDDGCCRCQEDQERSGRVLRQQAVEQYLAPLCLPAELIQTVLSHVASSQQGQLRSCIEQAWAHDGEPAKPRGPSPILIGCSVSVGYLLGGLLPLSPYFFVDDVLSGLRWSFGICVLALFIFGFVKDYLLHARPAMEDWHRAKVTTQLAQWPRIKHSICEGVRMVIFGSIAAVAAVLCVKAFEGTMS
ncbi:Uu.00g061880.m01.CDS01 [Anthostomella pinea]|uniref:Uu.00g061880.m01.CDS01 n=1 Tax=Anthostomella pinea TaxID=933095 RepID=A0AAI8VTC5_9PEZI|nr:Uu.00g061880.m01.CDS01 [Anthostomella pinea]